MAYPRQFRYTKEHEWIHLEGSRAKIGITDHAQGELGDVVFVELPAVGTKVKKGDRLATVESVKAVSDVYAPMAGEVTQVNTAVESSPETINQDPHGKGWLVIIEVTTPSEVDTLLTADHYEQHLSES
jgi:glycine cleavage system H protein